MEEQHNMETILVKAREIEKKRKKRNLIFISGITIITILYILYSSIKINKVDNENAIIKKENQNFVESRLIEDSARRVIIKFFNFQNSKDSLNIINLLSDTVGRYYLADKVITKDSLFKSNKFEINQKGKYVIDTTFKISVVDDTILALIITPTIDDNNKTNELLHELKLNKNYRIFYVRAYNLNSDKVKEKFGVK